MSVANAAVTQRREAEGMSDMRANADRVWDSVPCNIHLRLHSFGLWAQLILATKINRIRKRMKSIALR
ncbi:MAG: hypothetical protein FWH28_01360 [Clostridiales bacterium]|nr:hypothetical protein [Clostridiales bacterium]